LPQQRTGEPVPRSRQARSAYKAQPSAVGFDGGVDVSAHSTLRDHGRCDRGDGSFGVGCGFDLHEAGKIIGENFTYIARNFVPGIIGSLTMALSI